MRSPLAKAVRKRFQHQMKTHLPQFHPIKTDTIVAGNRLFGWHIRDGLTAFLCLAINRYEQFTVEGAWSEDGRFPTYILPGNPVDFPEDGVRRDDPEDGRFRFLVPMLWQPKTDYWWGFAPRPSVEDVMALMDRLARGIVDEPPLDEWLAKVNPLVDDAIEKVRVYAIPYFQEIS